MTQPKYKKNPFPPVEGKDFHMMPVVDLTSTVEESRSDTDKFWRQSMLDYGLTRAEMDEIMKVHDAKSFQAYCDKFLS